MNSFGQTNITKFQPMFNGSNRSTVKTTDSIGSTEEVTTLSFILSRELATKIVLSYISESGFDIKIVVIRLFCLFVLFFASFYNL